MNIFTAYAHEENVRGVYHSDCQDNGFGQYYKKEHGDGSMYCSPTFNQLRDSAEVSDNYQFSSGVGQANKASQPGACATQDFSLSHQRDELSLTEKFNAGPSRQNDTEQDHGERMIGRQISFHKSSDLFGVKRSDQ